MSACASNFLSQFACHGDDPSVDGLNLHDRVGLVSAANDPDSFIQN